MRYKILLSVVYLLFLSNLLVAQEETINKLDESKKIEIENTINEFSKKPTDEIVNKIKQMGEPAFIEIRHKAKSKTKSNVERERAILLIEKLGDTEATEDLVNISKDESDNRYIRSRAAFSLYRIGRKNDLKVFKQLKDISETEKDESIRRNVIMAIGRIGQKEAISYLQSVINGVDTERVKASAIYGLGAVDDGVAIDVLLKGLEEDNTSLTMEYARVLGRDKKSNKSATVLLKKILDLNKIKEKDDPLIGSKKMVIFEMLGEIKDQSVVIELRKFISSTNPLDMEDAAIALGKIGDIESLSLAIKRAKEINSTNMIKRLKKAYKDITGKEYFD